MLDTFTKQGYVLDKSRLINGQIFDEDYFEHLIALLLRFRKSEQVREDFTRKSQIYMGDMEKDIRTHPIHVVKWNGTKWKNYICYRDYLNARR